MVDANDDGSLLVLFFANLRRGRPKRLARSRSCLTWNRNYGAVRSVLVRTGIRVSAPAHGAT